MCESLAIDFADATRRERLNVEKVREFHIIMEEQMLTTTFRLSMHYTLSFRRYTIESHYWQVTSSQRRESCSRGRRALMSAYRTS
jgi:hypothetical protein